MITVLFFGVKKGDPKLLQLEHVPRVGDEITLDNNKLYKVVAVRWNLTSGKDGLRQACVDLEYIEDVKF